MTFPFAPADRRLPTIADVSSLRGGALGADLLRIAVRDASDNLIVSVDARPGAASLRAGLTPERPRWVQRDPSDAVIWMPVPPRLSESLVVVVVNLTAVGLGVPNARAEWTGCPSATSATGGLARIDRITVGLVEALRAYAAPTAKLALVSDLDAGGGGVRMVPMSDAPALTLAGPRIEVARLRTPDRAIFETILTSDGVVRRPHPAPLAVDLAYTLTGTSRSAAELLALLSSVATFVARTRWLELRGDPHSPGAPIVRWDLDADTPFAAEVVGAVHLFRAGVRVRDVAMPWLPPPAPPADAAGT